MRFDVPDTIIRSIAIAMYTGRHLCAVCHRSNHALPGPALRPGLPGSAVRHSRNDIGATPVVFSERAAEPARATLEGPVAQAGVATTRAMSIVEITPTGRLVRGSTTQRWERLFSTISSAACSSASSVVTVRMGVTALCPAVRVSRPAQAAATRSRSETMPMKASVSSRPARSRTRRRSAFRAST